ncbi:MAG: tRNA 5-methoxyuridine(34)/uridine 5-oxyacetic acid(34) synthase CmoB [Wenzhouxiangella sp.]
MRSVAACAARLAQCFGEAPAQAAWSAHRAVLQGHGDYDAWLQALLQLPAVEPEWRIQDGCLHAGAPALDLPSLRASLRRFMPWRKGPLVLGGVPIRTEWRSDWKWARIAPHIDLKQQHVLDVGAGNGYFGWRMLEQGASQVLGCDPTPLFVMQHAVISHFAGPAAHELLALRLEDLPPGLSGFDTVFSMGVLYHRRDPLAHLEDLRKRLRSGGQLVLETLILPGSESTTLALRGRYAGMRNVHVLPTLPRLLEWLARAGFSDGACVDVSVTSQDEQQSTEWMPFHSLLNALHPDDQALTVEGLPRPHRAMLLARL